MALINKFEIMGKICGQIRTNEIKSKEQNKDIVQKVTNICIMQKDNHTNESKYYFVELWNNQAKFILDYGRVGSVVMVTGHIREQRGEDGKIKSYRLVGDEVNYLSNRFNTPKDDEDLQDSQA